MGLQSQWIKQVITQAKMNNMTVIGETGTVLAGLSGKQKGELVIAYDTSAGFLQWHVYAWDGVSAWVDVTLPSHKHTGVQDGGKFVDVRLATPIKFWEYLELLPNLNDWYNVLSGAGAAFNMHDDGTNIARRYQTGTTSTGYSTGRKGGVGLDYGLALGFQWLWQLSAVNNLYFNLGINMEDINVATNNNAKIGLEWCDGQPAANYFVTTASGSARSSSDSTVPISTGLDGVKMIFTPAVQAQYTFDNATVINKTTNLPTGTPNNNNVLREGIKNNNGGVADRTLRIIGVAVIGEEGHAQWVS